MKQILLALIFGMVLSVSQVDAQTEKYKTGLSFKALFMDYQTMNGGEFSKFKEYHHGFEIGLHRNLTKNLNINVPFKVGVVQSHNRADCFHKTVYGGDLKLNYQFYNEKNKIVPYILAGIGGVAEMEGKFNLQASGGIGVNIKISPKAYINWQSEYRKSFEDDRDNLHHGLGFVYLFGKSKMDTMDVKDILGVDSDGDGIIDDLDLCPSEAGVVALQGCPDTDGDGIADYEDACPEFAGLKELKGCPDSDGDGISDNDDECPNMAGVASNNGCPDNDADNDGIPDSIDKCPNIPGPASNNGCPMTSQIIDKDGDGIADSEDKCPNSAGPISTGGCPDADGDGIPDFEDKCPRSAGPAVYGGCPDTDGDGIDDSRDKCPNSAGPVSTQGCPEISVKDKETLDIAMRAVQFDTGRSTIKSESYTVLKQISEIMNRYPDYNLSIEGHTDNTGSASNNQVLSQRRAQACADYLVSLGISKSRLSHAGYGESRPISDNNTLRGKALNRRVEFNLIPR